MRSSLATRRCTPTPSASALLSLVRWPNALIAAAGVILGAWWTGGDPRGPHVVAATLAALALAAFANAYNDVQDVAIDRVAHPKRPLATGRLRPAQALAIARVAAVASVILATAAAPGLGVMSLLVLAAMQQYSLRVKRSGLAGNVLVAVVASLPFLYGGWSVGHAGATWPLVALAMPLHLAREIAKDIDDLAGDALSRRTLPAVLGLRAARATFVVALILFFVAVAIFARHHPLLRPLLLAAVLLALASAWCALAGRRGGPLLLKSAMVCAMASLLGARGG
jgi:geranylgeranylglycerol-phosphate geranylgeranyltransferase